MSGPPVSAKRFPVLLQRTPYDKRQGVSFGLKAAARGYVVIVEDVRGRYASDGEWDPFVHESEDGFDTVEWAAALPYVDGKVGMYGASYVGATQLLAAVARPPHLAGICPIVTASNYHDNWTYQGGAFEQWFAQSWTAGLIQDTLARANKHRIDALDGVRRLPLTNFPPAEWQSPAAPQSTAGAAPYVREWLAHPDYDEFWKRIAIDEHFADISVPALHIAAWYDIFLDGSLRNFSGIRSRGDGTAARDGQRLLVFVGGHAGWFDSRKIGAVDFGPEAPFDVDEVTLRWYDHLLRGLANGVERETRVRLFVMGSNVWRDETDWPLKRAKATRYYLHSRGNANGRGEGSRDAPPVGSLDTRAPSAEKPDQFQYDPRDPVPTIGGPLCCAVLPSGIGPQDQRPAETRGDVLLYTTPAFTRDTEITGPISLDLYVSSSAVDTDFTGMLIDVWPNGFAQNLTSGILRLRYRGSMERAVLAQPATIYKITVDLAATSNSFLAGHRLRLQVSSSDFPRFDRNMNTGEIQAGAVNMSAATNRVYHDRLHASALILPVVP